MKSGVGVGHSSVQTPLLIYGSLTLLLTYLPPSLLSLQTHFLFFCGFNSFALLSVHSGEWNVLRSQSLDPWLHLRPVLLGSMTRTLPVGDSLHTGLVQSSPSLCPRNPAPLAPPWGSGPPGNS